MDEDLPEGFRRLRDGTIVHAESYRRGVSLKRETPRIYMEPTVTLDQARMVIKSEDILSGDPRVSEEVLLIQEESNLMCEGEITFRDTATNTMYVKVDWTSLKRIEPKDI